jgi:hypothetical protein
MFYIAPHALYHLASNLLHTYHACKVVSEVYRDWNNKRNRYDQDPSERRSPPRDAE